MYSTWICRETAWVRILKYSWVPVIISSCATFVADKLTRSLKYSKITSSSSTMSWYSIFFITSQILPWKKSQYNNAYYFDQGTQRMSTTCEHDVSVAIFLVDIWIKSSCHYCYGVDIAIVRGLYTKGMEYLLGLK